MTTYFTRLFVVAAMLTGQFALAQDDTYQIKTLFNSRTAASGGYGAVTNKFTEINGQFANVVEVYGGWYINHKFLLGLGVAAATNNLNVPDVLSTVPGERMSYAYGQFGLMTEYTLWSHRAIHFSFHMLSGAGFTAQYMRSGDAAEEYWDNYTSYPHDTNWFGVVEPGVKLEMNVLKWMRFSPGISYRSVFFVDEGTMSKSALDGMALNLTLKFGKF